MSKILDKSRRIRRQNHRPNKLKSVIKLRGKNKKCRKWLKHQFLHGLMSSLKLTLLLSTTSRSTLVRQRLKLGLSKLICITTRRNYSSNYNNNSRIRLSYLIETTKLHQDLTESECLHFPVLLISISSQEHGASSLDHVSQPQDQLSALLHLARPNLINKVFIHSRISIRTLQ